jgi:hypothetical protein
MTTHAPPGPKGHESSEVPFKGVLWCLAGFIITAAVIHLALIGYGRLLGAGHQGFGRVHQLRPNEMPSYPAPALQVKPALDLQAYRVQAERDLNGTGWIDQAHGVTKIPVDRAMTLLLERGLPVRPAVQDGPTELQVQQQKAAADGAKAPEPPPARSRP